VDTQNFILSQFQILITIWRWLRSRLVLHQLAFMCFCSRKQSTGFQPLAEQTRPSDWTTCWVFCRCFRISNL